MPDPRSDKPVNCTLITVGVDRIPMRMMRETMMKRIFAAFALLIGLSGCTLDSFLPTGAPAADLGNFSLAHNIVIAPNPHKGPGSRDATSEELIEAVEAAIETRLRPYEGEKLYNIGLSIDGYALAEAGVPLVMAPKSALIIHVTLWDDAAGEKVNEEAHQIVVLEEITAKTLIGSGFFSTGDQQLNVLASRAAVALEEWLVENNQWFGVEPSDAEATSIDDSDE